jgi:hypothetical protein
VLSRTHAKSLRALICASELPPWIGETKLWKRDIATSAVLLNQSYSTILADAQRQKLWMCTDMDPAQTTHWALSCDTVICLAVHIGLRETV